MSRMTGRLDIVATALDALHHGAGSEGNTQLLRTQEVILEDGSQARVPFISGNSLKHMIRDGAVRFALDAMQVEDHSLSKAVVDLLFSGGHLAKGSQSVRIATARELAVLFPALSICGYSAGNTMVASKLRVDNLHLVCHENAARLPAGLSATPHARIRAGGYRSEEFGTRHDAARLPHVDRVLALEDRDRSDASKGRTKDVKAPGKDADSAQMIYDFQTLKAGSVLWGGVGYEDLTHPELVAFRSGLSYACEGRHADGGYIFPVGAKRSIGWGRVSMVIKGTMRRAVDAPVYEPSSAALPTTARADVDHEHDGELAEYVATLYAQRADILAALEAVA